MRIALALLCLLRMLPAHANQALQNLIDGARQSHSATMVIWQDGHELGHYYAGGKAPGPIELMSVTKSVVALGIGQLLADGKIKSLDQPVADFYPEWRQGQKKDITIRMLMNHRSGLENVPRTDVEIGPAPDAIQLALTAELSSKPGSSSSYNNKAVNLLAGIIEKASGKPMDAYFREGLFKVMDIHPGSWEKDKAGHPYAMSGLPLTAADLGKLGQLVMDRGNWHGKQLLPAGYVDTMLGQVNAEGMGLLWWQNRLWTHFDADPAAFNLLRQRGVPEETVKLLEHGLQGTHFDSVPAMHAGLEKILGPQTQTIMAEQFFSRNIGPYRLFKVSYGPVVAYDGNGDGGQYVVILPAAHIVAVRQIDSNNDQEKEGEGYDDFVDRVLAVAKSEGRLPPAQN